MSSPIYTIAPHVTLPQCAARMVALGVRRLTVTAGEQPVGIISDTDIFRAGQGRRVAPQDRGSAGPRPQIRHITRSQVHAAADVMDRDVLSVPFETTVSQALATMEANNVISLLVEPAERGGELGIVTQRDVVSKVVAQEQDPDTVTVGEISSSPIFTVSPQTPIAECSDLMAQRNIRRLPVREHGKIVGMVSDTDIFAAVEERGWEAEVNIEPPAADRQTDAEAVVVIEEVVEMVTEPIAMPAQTKKVVGPKRGGANRPKTQKAPQRKARAKTASKKPAPKKRR